MPDRVDPATMARDTLAGTSPTKEIAIKRASDWPCPIGPVGDDRKCRIGLRVMNRSERDASVVTRMFVHTTLFNWTPADRARVARWHQYGRQRFVAQLAGRQHLACSQ